MNLLQVFKLYQIAGAAHATARIWHHTETVHAVIRDRALPYDGTKRANGVLNAGINYGNHKQSGHE